MPGYYEAKPQREMYFDDVQLAIIPEGTPSDITDFFDEYNVKYTTYKKGLDWETTNANISNAVKEYLADNPVADSYIRYQYIGTTDDGTEVYASSEESKNKSLNERRSDFVKDFVRNYKDTTVEFERNGHTYTAEFDSTRSGGEKFFFDGKNSHLVTKGLKAKSRLLFDGDLIRIVGKPVYHHSSTEKDIEKNKKHKNALYWDYFYKSIFVDGVGYDVIINLRYDSPNKTISNIGDAKKIVYNFIFVDNKKRLSVQEHITYSNVSFNITEASNETIPHSNENSQENSSESFDKMQLSPINEEHPEAKWGLNFHDATGEHLAKVFDGSKKYETRNENAPLDKSVINTWSGIVQTGNGKAILVGYWQLGEGQLKSYKWLKDHAEELGNDGTDYEATEGESKWVYRILKKEKLDTPREVDTRGIRKRSLEGDNPVADSYIRYMYAEPPVGIEKWWEFDFHSKEHSRAKEWASRDDVKTKDWCLEFYRNRWYIIEAFDDMPNGYLVTKFIPNKQLLDYQRLWEKEYNNDGRTKESLVGLNNQVSGNYWQTTENVKKQSVVDNDVYEYSSNDLRVQQLGNEAYNGRQQNNADREPSNEGNLGNSTRRTSNRITTNEASSNEDAFSMPKNQYEGATSDNRSILANALKTDNTISLLKIARLIN